MLNAKTAVYGVYGFVTVLWALDVHLFGEQSTQPGGKARAIERAERRGEYAGLPRLDPNDAMANAAILNRLLDAVPARRPLAPGARTDDPGACTARPRAFAVRVGGRTSWVRFGARAVCQLQLLKRISAAQSDGRFGEIAAFVLGTRLGEARYVDVSRLVVPPFQFTDESIHFVPADLGPLAAGERFIGTWHTHPEGDLEQGSPSWTDLRFLRGGRADFHGTAGPLGRRGVFADWLFDIVDPRDGTWNVFAHDEDRLEALWQRCAAGEGCQVDDLRVAGSPFYLQARYYEVPEGTSPDIFGG